MTLLQKGASTLCLISIICTLIELLIPEGKTSKTMHLIISLFAVSCVGNSIFSTLKNFNFNFKNSFDNNTTLKSTNFMTNLKNQTSVLASEKIKDIINDNLKKIEVIPKKIEIFMDKFENDSILIIKADIYIERKFKDFKSKIYDEIDKKLNIKSNIIEV